MGPTHNNQNGPGGPKKGGLVKITTPEVCSGSRIFQLDEHQSRFPRAGGGGGEQPLIGAFLLFDQFFPKTISVYESEDILAVEPPLGAWNHCHSVIPRFFQPFSINFASQQKGYNIWYFLLCQGKLYTNVSMYKTHHLKLPSPHRLWSLFSENVHLFETRFVLEKYQRMEIKWPDKSHFGPDCDMRSIGKRSLCTNLFKLNVSTNRIQLACSLYCLLHSMSVQDVLIWQLITKLAIHSWFTVRTSQLPGLCNEAAFHSLQ